MPISLKSIIDDKKHFEIDFGDGNILNITAKISVFTPAYLQESRKKYKMDSDFIPAQLVDSILEWDFLESEKGSVLPIDIKTMSNIPMEILHVIYRKIAVAVAVRDIKEEKNKKK